MLLLRQFLRLMDYGGGPFLFYFPDILQLIINLHGKKSTNILLNVLE